MKNITPINIYNGISNFIFDIGNTGRIVEHIVLERNEFKGIYSFYTKNRGVVVFNKKSCVSLCGEFYSDPRKVLSEQKYIHEEILYCDKQIDYFTRRKISLIDELSKILDKDKEVIDKFIEQINFRR